jgi:hypothetical protein
MIESPSYPYTPERYGIPFDQIPASSEFFLVQGGSSRDLNCKVSRDVVSVEDVVEPWFEMDARVSPHGVLTLHLATRSDKRNPANHPDFFASKFVDFAIGHFSSKGINIKKFNATWFEWPGSTNYSQFMEHFTLTGDEEYAASQTWSAKVIAKHGFTKIESVKQSGKMVTALFVKES